MKNKNEIEKIERKIIPLLKKHNVSRAGIFGSYARGEQNKRSDVDILVEVNKDMGLIEFISFKMLLEKAIKRKIDLVEYQTIRKELKDRILNEEIPIQLLKKIINYI